MCVFKQIKNTKPHELDIPLEIHLLILGTCKCSEIRRERERSRVRKLSRAHKSPRLVYGPCRLSRGDRGRFACIDHGDFGKSWQHADCLFNLKPIIDQLIIILCPGRVSFMRSWSWFMQSDIFCHFASACFASSKPDQVQNWNPIMHHVKVRAWLQLQPHANATNRCVCVCFFLNCWINWICMKSCEASFLCVF